MTKRAIEQMVQDFFGVPISLRRIANVRRAGNERGDRHGCGRRCKPSANSPWWMPTITDPEVI